MVVPCSIDDLEEQMNKDEIIAEYLNTIKVQKVDLKFHATPSKLKGKKKTVPMEFLAGLDTAARKRLNTKFKILGRGFDVDEELEAAGLKGSFSDYCAHEDAVKTDFIYSVDGVGSVILTEDVEKFKQRVAELQAEASALQVKLVLMLKEKVYGFAHELYLALCDVWGNVDPEWWTKYVHDNPMDNRSREVVFGDLMFKKLSMALELKEPDFWVLLTRFNAEIAADQRLRKAFKSAFRQYLRTGSGRDLDWLIGKDPNAQPTLF